MFEIAGGGVVGKDHVRVGKNAQDAFAWQRHEKALVAAVCDGCGSSDHSEVGAKIGAKLVVKSVLQHFLEDPAAFDTESGLGRVKRSVLAHIQTLADAMEGSFTENVQDYFLFTVIGVLIDPAGKTRIFGCGDGVIYVNNAPTIIRSPGNMPAYLAYNIVPTTREAPTLKVLFEDATEKIDSILIGTDGVEDLAASWSHHIPGREERIGPISHFWEQNGYFKNPFSVGHRLNLINRSLHKVDWEKKALSELHGPLKDDTTFVVIRRKKA
jgi:hypothetical protein